MYFRITVADDLFPTLGKSWSKAVLVFSEAGTSHS